MPRGWTSVNLTLIQPDERLWTVTDASRLLGRPAGEIRTLINARGIESVGARPQGGVERRGRQPRVYRAIDIIRVYDALSKAA